jgi:hypothetical protein
MTARVPRQFLLALTLSGIAAAALLPGCGTVSKVDADDQQIRIDPLTPVALDIENFSGNVRVVVDPTLTSVKPVIKKRVSWGVDQFIREDAQAAIHVRSRTVEQDGRSVITIKTSTKWIEPKKTWVNLTLYVPRCDGVRVWNRGGKVTLEGVSGAIQVENAGLDGEEAPIEVRTDKAIVDPVMLVTDSGTVAYQVGPGSAGQFTLDSADDAEEFDCKVLSPDLIHSDGKVTTASLNAGDNQVLLKSGKGSVIVLVMTDPMSYTNTVR